MMELIVLEVFSSEKIAEFIGGKVITWDNGRPVTIFTSQPDDYPAPESLHFLFEGYDDEDELLKNIINSGASGVVVRKSHSLNIEKWSNAGIGIIEVSHMTEPYIQMCKKYREQFTIPFIEVTGSSGKTTTKEMIGAILNERMNTFVGYENYNAPSGVAYNIFCLRDSHKAAVLEAGMKGPGIMAYSSNIIKPDIAVITAIHRSHYVSLGSIDNIINAKAELLDCISEKGTLIINGDDDNSRKLPLDRFKGEVLRFGFSRGNDIWAKDIRCHDFKTYFKVVSKRFMTDCLIKTVGRYNVSNALASILVGLKLGLNIKEAARGLARFEPVNGRLRIYKGVKDTILVDDNFNANPDSTKAMIQEVPYFAEGRPVVLIMGDMERPDVEIENYAREVHFMIGEEVSKIDFKYLIAVGQWSKEYINGAIKKGVPESKTAYFKTIEEAKEHINDYVVPGSVMVFKASVYTKVKRLMELIKAE